jgi:ribosomal protein S13
MRISITEEQYNKLIQANEVVGVPEGIYETAKSIYRKYIESLVEEINLQFGNIKIGGSSDINFIIMGDYRVGDISFTGVHFMVTFEFDKFKKVEIEQMSLAVGDRLTSDYKVSYKKIGNRIAMGAKYQVPDDVSEEDLINSILKFETKTISSIAHELKHAYDFEKKPIRNAGEKVKYHSIEDLMVSVRPLMKFKTMLYYSHVVEDSVRNSEIYTLMKLKGITKKEFKNFLSKTNTYDFLKYMMNYDYNKFIEEMYNSIKGIESFLSFVKIDHKDMNDGEKVTMALKKFYQIVSRRRKEFLDSVMMDMQSDLMMLLASSLGIADNIVTMGENEAKVKAKKKINKHINSYTDYIDFYQRELSDIKISATNTLKKLGKLYSLAED